MQMNALTQKKKAIEKRRIDFDRLNTDFSVERSENNESGTAH